MTAPATLPRALRGTIIALAGAALAPGIVVLLVASIDAIVSNHRATFEAGLQTALFFFAVVSYVAGLHAIILGLPAFLVLRAFDKVNWMTAVAGGFLVGALPISMTSASAGGAAVFGGFGVCGGAVFWFLWSRFGAQPSSSD